MTNTMPKPKEGPGLGTLFTLIIFILLVVGAMQFSGGSSVSHTPSGTQVVTISPEIPEPTKNNLQLYTFGGATPVYGAASIAPIVGAIPGQIVNINAAASTSQTINSVITGQDSSPKGEPGGSTPGRPSIRERRFIHPQLISPPFSYFELS